MPKNRIARLSFFLAIAAFFFSPVVRPQPATEKPKVRAITAFIRIDRAHYGEQVKETLVMLRKAKAAFEQAGYEVQSIRITTQPFPDYVKGLSVPDAVAFMRDYEHLARVEGFDASIGPALADSSDAAEADLLGKILSSTNTLNASLVVADERGVRWESVRLAAKVMKYLSEHSPGGAANFNFAAAALVPAYTPFFPASNHNGPGRHFAVALQSANVVAEAFAGAKSAEEGRQKLESALGAHAHAIEAIALRVEKETGWTYEGIDLSPAPLKEVSIGGAIENLTGGKFGSGGTMTAAATVTAALRSIPVKRAGYSGLMVPVLEDSILAQRWSEGTLTVDSLLAYSAVCGTGLDTVPLPGDVTVEQLERMIGDMASLAVKLHKPLSARLMPVKGKKPGERTEFNDPFLVNATIQPLR